MWKALLAGPLFPCLMAACAADAGPVREIEPLAAALTQPTSIAVDATQVYWLSGDARGKVLSMAKSGGEPTVLSEAEAPHGIALNADFVYFGESQSALKRVSKAGGSAASVALQDVTDFALGSARAFGTSAGTNEVWSVPLQGGAVFHVNDFAVVDTPSAVVVDDSEIFWINRLQAEISAFPIEVGDTPGVSRVVASWPGDNTTELVLAGDQLVWADHSTGEILRVSKSGGDPTVLAAGAVQFLEADATHLYFTGDDRGTVKIRRVLLTGGTIEDLVELDEVPGGLALDATHLYWSSPTAGTVQAIVKEL